MSKESAQKILDAAMQVIEVNAIKAWLAVAERDCLIANPNTRAMHFRTNRGATQYCLIGEDEPLPYWNYYQYRDALAAKLQAVEAQ